MCWDHSVKNGARSGEKTLEVRKVELQAMLGKSLTKSSKRSPKSAKR